MKRKIMVLEDRSMRDPRGDTVRYTVNLCGAKGGVHYVLMATPRLAARHRLQPALKMAAKLAAKAIEQLEPELPS